MAEVTAETPEQGAPIVVQAQVVQTQVIGQAQMSMDDDEVNSKGSTHKVGCCAAFGYGPEVPNITVKTKDGSVLRYNFVYRVEQLFGVSPGLEKKLLDQVPEEIAKKGLQPHQWTEYTSQLRGINEIENKWGFCPSLLCVILSIPTFFCCCTLCKLYKEEILKWDQAFREWQAKFNMILEPLGMFVKSQSSGSEVHVNGQKVRHIHRWLAFALTPAQVEKLKSEPHLSGDIQNFQGCCDGLDESVLCMHQGF